MSTRSAAPHFAVRQLTFNISQAVAFLIILNFAATTIVPKIHSIFWQLDIVHNRIFAFIQWFVQWKILFTIIIFWIFVLAIGAISAWSWRRTQRLLSGRLLVIGSTAKVPEAEMGTGDQAGLSFAELSAAAGWKAQTPNELARVVAREEFRQRKIATWLPALGAAVAPLIFAIPVGALVIGIMHLLISMIYHIEALG